MEATLVRREGLSEEVILLFLPRWKTGATELILTEQSLYTLLIWKQS